MQPITLYWAPGSPNPTKALVFLEELGVPYETKLTPWSELKSEPYTKVNPNGRLPSIYDPNTGITLWETGAIIFYLIDQYDKDQKLTYTTVPEKYLLQQYSYFQASGQGPYFGQASWFNLFHSERLESAIVRYVNEVNRITSVLDGILHDRAWLVGDKCTFADLSFVMWNVNIQMGVKGAPVDFEMDKYPNFKRWHEALVARPSVQKVLEVQMQEQISSPGKT